MGDRTPLTEIGNYRVESVLGEGAFGIVYKARSREGAVVAIKVMRSVRRHVPRGGDAFQKALAQADREERLLRELSLEEGFVPWVGSGELTDRTPYVVMAYLAGGTLESRIGRGPLPIDDVIALAQSLAEALGRAHARGIVHRDLKPANVLFDESGRPFIADLGLAKHFLGDVDDDAARSAGLTKTGELKGTLVYMAPEQSGDAKRVGPPADVFALGACLFECLAGARPFDGVTPLEILSHAAQGAFTPVRRLRPETPRWLAAIVERCLAPEPDARFSDGADLARALVARSAGAPAPPARGGEGAGATLVRGGAGRWLALAAVAGVAAVGTAVWAFRVTGAPEEASPGAPVAATASSGPRIEAPAWYLALPPGERPALPLPAQLRFGRETREYINFTDESVLLYVPPGVFLMGSDRDPSERPVHEVELSGYFIGKYEVTNAQFARFVKATGYKTEREAKAPALPTDLDITRFGDFSTAPGGSWKNPLHKDQPAPGDHPLVCVTWDEAHAFLKWARLDFPSEAQWERAAGWDPKTRTMRVFSWGDFLPTSRTARVANLADAHFKSENPEADVFPDYDDGFTDLAPVGSFPAGASPCDARDMTGNAVEWCKDACADDVLAYPSQRVKDPVSEVGEQRVVRGGGYATGLHNPTPTTTVRGAVPRGSCQADRGFRVALDPGSVR